MTAPHDDARAQEVATRLRDNWCQCPLHTLFPQRISDLVDPTLDDLKAACALIGTDSYGKPHWTPDTIDPHNSVVQAFAKHARRAGRNILAERAAAEPTP